MKKANAEVYEFGPFRLEVAEGRLIRDDAQIPLTAKVFEMLLLLVQRHGQLVEKEELMHEIWPDSDVEENNLTVNISLLRKALGESREKHQYIETVPKRGYRFVADVKEVRTQEARLTPTKADVQNKAANSLMVLPLMNMTSDPELEYLSDGIAENIINGLSQLPQLKVISSSAAFRYKGKEVSAQQIGSDLGVRAVLTGRLLRFDNRLIIRVELVETADGWQIWGEQYNQDPADLFRVQEKIVADIVEKLRVKLTAEWHKRVAQNYTANVEAYHLYLRGRYFWSKYTVEGLKKSIGFFNRAIELDPYYALAYAGLADSHITSSDYYEHPKEAIPKAKAMAEKALELNGNLAQAHISLGMISLLYDWDWSGAERQFRRAIELDPNNMIAHKEYGAYLMCMGRLDEALIEVRIAEQLDPVSLQINVLIATAYYLQRLFDRAIAQSLKTLEMDPNFTVAYYGLGLAYTQKGEFSKAISVFQKAAVVDSSLIAQVRLAYAYALMGKPRAARDIIAQMGEQPNRPYISPYNLATVYAALGEKDKALAHLERAYAEHDGWLIWMKVSLHFDNLRSDSRFKNLLQKLGLDTSS